MTARIVTVPAAPEAICPYCGVPITVRPGSYSILQQTGGCCHVVLVQAEAGRLQVHYCDSE